MCREDNSSDMKSNSETLSPLNSKMTGWNWNQSDTSNIFRLTCVKLKTALENFKGVVSDDLSFASVEIDKNCWLPLPRWKSLCHRLSRDQPQPGSFFQRPNLVPRVLWGRVGEDPGNEVANDQGRQRRGTLGTRLFLGLMGYQFFLPMVLRWRTSRVEAPLSDELFVKDE